MNKAAVLPGLAIVCVIALTNSAYAQTYMGDDHFDFASEKTPAWTLTARTNIFWPEENESGQPTIAGIECRGESAQFSFSVNDAGELQWLRMTFLGAADRDGDRGETSLLGDHLWLYLDGERWEYANIPVRSIQFSNLDYPRMEGDGIITGGWRGHPALRKSPDQPWLHLSRFYERLVAAKKIAWGFKSRDWTVVDRNVAENRLPRAWQTTRYPIDNAGLQNAVSWCARQVSSDAAYVLPDGIKKRIALKRDQ